VIVGFGQNDSETIKNIRKEYVRINGLSSLQRVTLSGEDFLENIPDGGGELTGYFKKDSLLKMTEWIGLSFGNMIREFYFRNKELFFVYEKFDSFLEIKNGLDLSHTKRTFEGRYYFNNKRLIKKLESGKIPLYRDKGDDMGQLLADDARENSEILKKKKQ
jgi:hypothetical protein